MLKFLFTFCNALVECHISRRCFNTFERGAGTLHSVIYNRVHTDFSDLYVLGFFFLLYIGHGNNIVSVIFHLVGPGISCCHEMKQNYVCLNQHSPKWH